jgi:hypothetical protein
MPLDRLSRQNCAARISSCVAFARWRSLVPSVDLVRYRPCDVPFYGWYGWYG